MYKERYFEELYLSYDRLIDLNKSRRIMNHDLLDTLTYVHDCINNFRDYFTENPLTQAFIIRFPEAGVNREHFANKLLIEATSGIPGYFRILKESGAFDKQGECWLLSCKSIQNAMNQYQVENICNTRCTFHCKNKETVDKLLDLNNNSILKGTLKLIECKDI